MFNLFGGAVNWMSKKQFVVVLSTTEISKKQFVVVLSTTEISKKQFVVALSTIEAKYMAANHASKEVVWLQRLCSSMGIMQRAIRIDCDSQSAIFLANNLAYHSKTNHTFINSSPMNNYI